MRFDDASSAPVDTTPAVPIPNPRDPYLWPQRESLKLALQNPEVAGDYFDGLSADAFTHPAYRMVREGISRAGGVAAAHSGVDWIATVAGEMTDLMGRNLVSELAVEEIIIEAQHLSDYADSVLSRLQESEVGNQIAQLKSQLQRMRPSDNEQAYNSLFADLVALEQARRELNERAFRGLPAE